MPFLVDHRRFHHIKIIVYICIFAPPKKNANNMPYTLHASIVEPNAFDAAQYVPSVHEYCKTLCKICVDGIVYESCKTDGHTGALRAHYTFLTQIQVAMHILKRHI